jgi:ATP-dependent 26S proteasome regulatory subunit
MELIAKSKWRQANYDNLMAEIENIKCILINFIKESEDINELDLAQLAPYPNDTLYQSKSLEFLGQLFNLSLFDKQLLLLCAGIELDPGFSILCAKAHGRNDYEFPTLSLAFALFKNHGHVLQPQSPLRYWQLLEFDGKTSLNHSPLRISEWTLNCLLAESCLDNRLLPLLKKIKLIEPLLELEQKIGEHISEHWETVNKGKYLPIVQLISNDVDIKQQIAASAVNFYNVSLYEFDLYSLPCNQKDLNNYACLLRREALVKNCVYLINCERLLDTSETNSNQFQLRCFLEKIVENLPANYIFSTTQPLNFLKIELLPIYIDKPTPEERAQLWLQLLGEQNHTLQTQIKKLAQYFVLNRQQIDNLAQELLTQSISQEHLIDKIWHQCRQQVRQRMNGLAKYIVPKASKKNIALPDKLMQKIQQIIDQVSNRYTIYHEWGFADKNTHGLGITTLFTGPSGTGKTLAAEVIAGELQLDLLHVELSAIMSKYIGETEKNLNQIFNIAEESGAVLLFDEADSLFTKRFQVNNSTDQYANLIVNYLLQRIESYRGLAILTTNAKHTLDEAFVRRFRFIIDFSMPDYQQRIKIWQSIFPANMPIQVLDYEELAKIPLSGGTIYNIAINAAFKAAAQKKILDTEIILHVIRDTISISGNYFSNLKFHRFEGIPTGM